MTGSRFSRSRAMQVVAWIVFACCVGVIFTGYLVGPAKSVHAQEGVTNSAPAAGATNGAAEKAAPPADDKPQPSEQPSSDAPPEKPAEGEPADKPADEAAAPMKPQVGQGDPSTVMDRAISFLGIFFFLAIAFAMSNNRKRIDWRLVIWGVALQLIFAVIIFFVPGGEAAFAGATAAVKKLLEFTDQGSGFIFQSFVTNKWEPALINFTFAVLPTIIFFSSLMTILYHLGVMQRIVYVFAWVMQRTMRTSGAESLSAAANIFVGQTEAPLVIKPFVDRMTMSELMTVMTGGFATVAGGVMAAYVGMLERFFPDIAGHLIAASVMSAPAALVIGKMIFPETETPETSGDLDLHLEKEDINVLDAASRGAAEGLKLALNVGAMLLAFIALIALVNYLIGLPFLLASEYGGITLLDSPPTLQGICGYLFSPIAFIMGVPWSDCLLVGRLLGEKIILNEFVAYADLQSMLADPAIHLKDRSVIIATYALCGFANFGSIGIQLGGIGGIAPSRRQDLAKIAFRAMIAGTIAAFMTGTIAGILV